MQFNTSTKSIDVDVKLPEDAIFRVFQALLDDLDILPLARKLRGAIRNRDALKLLEATSGFNPQCIVEQLGNCKSSELAFSFMKLYQVGALIKKFPFKVPGISNKTRAAAAIEKFREYERVCRLYNQENYKALVKLSSCHPKFYGLLDDLRKEILDLIGESPNIESVYVNGRHGPGQTVASQYKSGTVTKYFKYSTLPYTVSETALPHAKAMIASDPRWIGALLDNYRITRDIPMHSPISMEAFWESIFRIISHSTIATVPKTAVIDRTIEMGPMLNIFLQLGVDSIIRRLLRRWGYDLDTQELNQLLAKLGSETNLLATLDLKGASDTISLKVCELLLPPLWYNLLLELRTDVAVYKDGNTSEMEYFLLEKMSAMGNGFTFVLESLIFGAATRVAMRRTKCWGKSAVYGDDIILPSKAAPHLIEILGLLGFSINKDKTFIDGPFRESCGKDFYNGYDVRPTFISEDISTVPRLFHLLNTFKLKEEQWNWPHQLEYRSLRKLLSTWIPRHFARQYHGPVTEDTDTHIFDLERPLPYDKDGYRFFNRLVERARIFKTGKNSFFFRKLMVDLRQVPEKARPKWDWSKRLDTGNAFDVTKRGATYFCCVRSKLPDKAI